MATSNQMATALLTEHLRYTPLTLLDDIINTVNELAFRAINAVEEGLNNATPEMLGFIRDPNSALSPEASREALEDAKQKEIDSGIVQLETLLNATVDKDFDKFEIYTLRNILSVGHEEEDLAGWVRLEHYKNLELASGADASTPEQVQLQRRKLHETIKLNNMLKAEEARNQAVLSTLHSLLADPSKTANTAASPFAFLSTLQQPTKTPSQSQSFQQNVEYAIKQLPALRQMLTQLKGSLQNIPSARHASGNDDAMELGRRQYVESQSRRALERKGVDLEDPVTAGAATGRKIGRDEVEGIEAVVQALDGDGAWGRDDSED